MSGVPYKSFRVAIACGGTGGHLFPGLAVGDELARRGCRVTLVISPKEIDQQAVKLARGMDVLTLPAVGLTRGRELAFLHGFWRAYRGARKQFQADPPRVALAMGGFTSAPPILAAKRLGAWTFLHESNAIPGRANRWLSWVVDGAFIGFPSASARLHTRRVKVTGTPVRPQFRPMSSAQCRSALGLAPDRPVVLVMGGSQGASGINELVVRSLKALAAVGPDWQWVHLTGAAEAEKVQAAYAANGLKAVVHPFLAEMELALGAATAAVSRAGASSLAELAAMQVPCVLIPYPAATDDHQWHNARAFEEAGAASLLQQREATPEKLTALLTRLVNDVAGREQMRTALMGWQRPRVAQEIAEELLAETEPARAKVSVRGAPARGDDSSSPRTENSVRRTQGTVA